MKRWLAEFATGLRLGLRGLVEKELRTRSRGWRPMWLLTGYLGEQIRTYFGDGSQWGLSIHYSQEATPMGTGGGLRDASSLLAEHFLRVPVVLGTNEKFPPLQN